MRKIGILGVPVLVLPGSMAQLVLLVFLNVIPCFVLACLKPYVYRGDAYFAHASCALTAAAPFLKLIGVPSSAADGILTTLLLVALVLLVLPDQLIERFEARVCSSRRKGSAEATSGGQRRRLGGRGGNGTRSRAPPEPPTQPAVLGAKKKTATSSECEPAAV